MSNKSYINDHDEAEELDADFFKEGTYGRPKLHSEQNKEAISISLDTDILQHYRDKGIQ